MSIVFFGSDIYSSLVLDSLISQGVEVGAVVTDKPKPKGRDQVKESNPVEKQAAENRIPVVYYPEEEKETSSFTAVLRTYQKRAGIAASFDHLLPKAVIELFPDGILNVHPSLLPQYRNVSPVQYAIAMGDTKTGVSIFKITEGIDNGEIVAQAELDIEPTDTTPTLSQKLFKTGALCIVKYLNLGMKVNVSFADTKPLIFTKRLTRQSGYIEWPILEKLIHQKPIIGFNTNNQLLAKRLEVNPQGNILNDLIRALTPWPGVWSMIPSKKGELRVTVTSTNPLTVKIAGKPKPISWTDFIKYYVN